MGRPRPPRELTQNEGMRRFPVLAGLILALALALASGVIQRAEELRGLRTTHPLVVTALGAAGIRRIVVRELARER